MSTTRNGTVKIELVTKAKTTHPSFDSSLSPTSYMTKRKTHTSSFSPLSSPSSSPLARTNNLATNESKYTDTTHPLTSSSSISSSTKPSSPRSKRTTRAFASQGLMDASLERYIYSFLVESNLDLIYLDQRREPCDSKNSSMIHNQGSSLSIIRRINKSTKRITQEWQDKFNALRKYLTANQSFKYFYLREITYSESRKEFLVNDLMHPIFERMSSVPTSQSIKMLKSVFQECDQWNEHSDQLPRNENAIANSKFELHQLYVRLGNLKQIQPPRNDHLSLSELKNQFKFLLFERIVYLLFKTNINKASDIVKPVESKSEVLSYVVKAEKDCSLIKCLFFSCIVPLTIAAILAGTLMPKGSGRDVVLGLSISFDIFFAFSSALGLLNRRDYLTQNTIIQEFRNRFLEEMDSHYIALDQDEDDVPDFKSTGAADSQNGDARKDSVERIEIRIDNEPKFSRSSSSSVNKCRR